MILSGSLWSYSYQHLLIACFFTYRQKRKRRHGHSITYAMDYGIALDKELIIAMFF
ncbi:MAG: hypothetical protein NTX92_05735 [Euryarchaeota archaeon]|nr:hypothetical protein [Euryarchaeota archaeon]